MKKTLLISVILIILLGCKTKNQDSVTTDTEKTEYFESKSFPKQIGIVSDFDTTLTKEEIADLEKIIREYKNKTTNQIAIVSITDTLTEDNFDQYALDLSNYWGIGTKEKLNGLTIIYSIKLRKIRISTGTETEKKLTDEICDNILNEKILPYFKEGDYYSGLKNGTNEFIRIWGNKKR